MNLDKLYYIINLLFNCFTTNNNLLNKHIEKSDNTQTVYNNIHDYFHFHNIYKNKNSFT